MSDPKVFTLTYELRSGNAQGEVIETATKENPAEFLFGLGNLVKEFEDNVQNLNQGETFDFIIEADNAYGQPDEKAVVDLPKNIFMVEGKLAEDLLIPGKIVPMRDQQGNPLNGIVKEVGEEAVTMDFNHPMAGHDLHFTGEVLSTRNATEQELEHGHVHKGGDDGNC